MNAVTANSDNAVALAAVLSRYGKHALAFVLSVAINVAALSALQSVGSQDVPEGEVYITELVNTSDSQLVALPGQASGREVRGSEPTIVVPAVLLPPVPELEVEASSELLESVRRGQATANIQRTK